MKTRNFFSSIPLALGMQAALTASLLTGVPAAFAQSEFSVHSAQPIRLTVAPNASSRISMKTLPKATCVLHLEGASDIQHKLFADDEGIVRFYIRPSAESDQGAHFDVDCAANGNSATFPVHVRSSSSPTAEMPAPASEPPKLAPRRSVRAALTEDEASNLSTEELALRGYPTRPDSEQAPDAFATWLKAVTRPSTFVKPRLVVNQGVRQSTTQVRLLNWSGFQLYGPANSYDGVEGTWYVPSVLPEHESETAAGSLTVYSSFWIGLDGYNTNDLVQDGTESDVTDYYVTICVLGECSETSYAVFTYQAWTQFLPQQPYEVAIPNFTVDPGDEIYSEVWMGNPCPENPSCLPPPTPDGGYAYFYMEDLTRSENTVIEVERLSSTTVGGYQAEWIMERPTVNGGLPDLANYGVAYMYGAYALGGTTKFGTPVYFPYSGANNYQFSMYNGGDLLSEVYPVTSSEMEFVWKNFH